VTTAPIDILLVEDNDDDVVMIREAFDEAKLLNIVNVVKDGEEALAFLHAKPPYHDAQRPGLVLLDISMPKKNGFEVLQALKADRALAAIPVVMLTTSTREEDVLRSYQNGACSYVSKPVDFVKLQKVVRYFSLYWTIVSEIPPAPKR